MAGKFKKGYYVNGHFVAEDSAVDLELKREMKGRHETSRTDDKRESDELQALGATAADISRQLRAVLEWHDTLSGARTQRPLAQCCRCFFSASGCMIFMVSASP